jgi:cytochrome c oxidase subunit 2
MTFMKSALRLSLPALAGLCAGSAWAKEPIALPAGNWDLMYHIWLIIAVGIYLIVAVPMLYFLRKYRYQEGVNEVGSTEEGGAGIEVLWTVIPLMIMIYLASQSFALYTTQRHAPADAMPVKVEGMMWGWSFEYGNGKKSISDLYVPVGKPVKLLMTSKDVIHSFHVPEVWFQFNKAGDYRAYCREYCGTAHSYMLATIKAVPADEFEKWLKSS